MTDNANTPASFLDHYVGEGKKFSDPETLAKGKYEADRHIERLESELAELRGDRDLEERLKALLNTRENTPNTPTRQEGAEAHQPAKPAAADIDLQAEVKKVLEETTRAQRQEANASEVKQKLLETYGDEAKVDLVIRGKAQELGLSVQYLQDVAAQSPAAFYSLVGLKGGSPAASVGPTRGDVNTAALSAPHTVKPGTYKFYQELRKTNPKAYQSQKVQMQMHADAQQKGAAFYE